MREMAATGFAVRVYDSGLVVRPEVSYESVERKLREAEEAYKRDKAVFESQGFSWDDEMLGWWINDPHFDLSPLQEQLGGDWTSSRHADKWNAGVA